MFLKDQNPLQEQGDIKAARRSAPCVGFTALGTVQTNNQGEAGEKRGCGMHPDILQLDGRNIQGHRPSS